MHFSDRVKSMKKWQDLPPKFSSLFRLQIQHDRVDVMPVQFWKDITIYWWNQ